jgi:ribonuclease BN (tRNA processing enzyme)
MRRPAGGLVWWRRGATALALGLALAPSAGAQRRFTPAHRCTEAQREAGCLLVLGSGVPVPDPARMGPAYAVVYGDRTFLFDAGAGVMRRAAEAGLAIDGFTQVFLTHLHTDHTLGLPDVLFTTWVMGRRRPMPVTGPPGTARLVAHLQAAWSEDVRVRTTGLERGQPGGERVTVHETEGGVAYDSAGVRIRAVRVPHGEWPVAFGYVIELPGRRLVLSGDTRVSAELEAAARDADVLVHETYPVVRLRPEDRPGGDAWPAYMRSVHTSDEEVGALAQRAGVRLVVLSHVVWMGGTEAELEAGVRRGGYRGPVRVARDLEVY